LLWGVPQGLLDSCTIQDFGVKVKKLVEFLRLGEARYARDGGRRLAALATGDGGSLRSRRETGLFNPPTAEPVGWRKTKPRFSGA